MGLLSRSAASGLSVVRFVGTLGVAALRARAREAAVGAKRPLPPEGVFGREAGDDLAGEAGVFDGVVFADVGVFARMPAEGVLRPAGVAGALGVRLLRDAADAIVPVCCGRRVPTGLEGVGVLREPVAAVFDAGPFEAGVAVAVFF